MDRKRRSERKYRSRRDGGRSLTLVAPRALRADSFNHRYPMPAQYRTRLFCNAQANIPIGAAASGYATVVMNGLFQPYATGNPLGNSPGGIALGGLNPSGYAGLTTFYSNYVILGGGIRVIARPQYDSDALHMALAPCMPGAAPINIDTADSVPGSDGPVIMVKYGEQALEKRIDIAQFFGRPILQDPDFSGQPGANPATLLRWDIAWRNVNNAFFVGNVPIEVEIFYNVLFSELISNLNG